jgi:hypothetical protein
MNNFILISFSVVVFSTLQCLGQVPSIEDVSASNESLNIAVSVNPGMVYQLNLSDDLVAWEPSGQFTTQSTSETVQIPIQEGNEQVFATISELGFESTFSGELLTSTDALEQEQADWGKILKLEISTISQAIRAAHGKMEY